MQPQQGIDLVPSPSPGPGRKRRAWAALLFGNDRNNTLRLEMQLRALRDLDPLYEHVTLTTPDVLPSVRKELEGFPTRIVPVAPRLVERLDAARRE